MEVGNRFRRMRHNLQTKKTMDEELKRLEPVIQRNVKVAQFVAVFRKDLAATLTTGFKEENVDKRKKRVEELTMAQNLREMSVDLDYLQTSCLHHVINGLGSVLHTEVDEKVKTEMLIERRVFEELAGYVDYEKFMNKSRDKLNSAGTDLEIAQKDVDKEPSVQHQETCDSLNMKYESLKDSLVTDIFTSSVSREMSISESVLTLMLLKRDFYKKMLQTYENAIPAIQSMISNAVPRPVYKQSLEEHLAVQREPIAFVITKACQFLRLHAMKEKGLFRVSGNAAKVKRIQAALNSGLFDCDEKSYQNDPHAVASALKAYLRELPDPLIMNALRDDWIAAISKETEEEQFSAIDACLQKMTRGHRDNFTFLMRFIYDLEANREETSMNASNLAIVFAPGITGMIKETGMNPHALKLVEFFITHAARIFNFGPPNALDSLNTSPQSTFSRAQSSISPRSFRPKEKAPPPPVDYPGTSGDLTETNTDDDDFFDDWKSACSSNGGSLLRSSTERRPNRPPPPSFRASTIETPKSRPNSYNVAVGARPTELAPQRPMTTSFEDVVGDIPIAPERKRLSVLSIGGMSRVGPTNTQPSSQESSSGSLVTDGGDNRTLVSLDGEPSYAHSSASVPLNVQPPPQSAKPKPPLPHKPKDLSNESSRL